MALAGVERHYVARARHGRLATADADGRPHVVPICFAVVGSSLVTPLDEKPKAGDPRELRRVRDIAENPRVAVVCDHWRENWSELGWVQVRGTASLLETSSHSHERAVAALRDKYDQYVAHDLEARPVIEIEIGSVVSWGDLSRDHGESS